MDSQLLIIFRALHILGVVLWIGGVAFVTLVLLPAVKELKSSEERVEFFEKVESRFATQARITTLVTGISGFYLVWKMDLWSRYTSPQNWWMHIMLLVWILFTIMLFILEPFILHKKLLNDAKKDPDGTYNRIVLLHRILLTLSLVAVISAMLYSHGFSFTL